MQRKLSERALREPEHQFEELHSLLYNMDWIRAAHGRVSSNAGSRTAGIDGRSISNFNENLEENLRKLRETLKAKVFEPTPVRRVYIPKANGKRRPLGIPTVGDRIVQETLRMVLEPIWESDFSQHSYGFRPNRSTHDAIQSIVRGLGGYATSYQWVIEGDIKSYFDSIPHKRLMKAIKKRIADKELRRLLWKFLRAGILERGQYQETIAGTPQGGIVSPLLANIYLHELDRYMETNYLNITTYARRKRRSQGKGNFLYFRYADDFVVLCNGRKEEALEMKEELKNLLKTMGLELSMEKTKVTHITEGFKFLGFWVERHLGSNGRMVPRVRVPELAIQSMRNRIRRIVNPDTYNDSVSAKILALNQLIRGWCQYYQITGSPGMAFSKLRPEVFWGFAHWLGRKYKVNMPVVMERFRQGDTLGTKTHTLLMPSTFKRRRHFVKIWTNPYLGAAKLKWEDFLTFEWTWDGSEKYDGGMDLRWEALLEKGTDCEKCGAQLNPWEAEVDHVKPRSSFKDPKAADKMDNLQILCTRCHRVKTQYDLKVLSRMR